jgi:N4-gp56 family major capsid protein
MANNRLTTARTPGVDYTKLDETQLEIMSKEILYRSQNSYRYAPLALRVEDLSQQRGGSISFVTYENLELGGKLEETVPIGIKSMDATKIYIQVDEYANAVGITELLVRTAADQPIQSAIKLMAYDYAKVLDKALMGAAMDVPATKYAYSGDVPAVDRAALTSGHKFDSKLVQDAVQVLSENNTPEWGGNGGYICLLTPGQARSLRNDPKWLSVTLSRIGSGSQFDTYSGEIGRFDNVTFLETNMQPIVEGTGGVMVHRALLLGPEEFGWAVALPMEVRDGGIVDFGRQRSFAWYTIFGAGVLNPQRGVILESVS